ncbi:alpha/beta hydrolase family protein [Larkinella sp.]|uniref:alpha/beta hydrolase family protein n=1 Tax=Larkinella sp. TaxID=2034517 RepID=UPI003BABDED1
MAKVDMKSNQTRRTFIKASVLTGTVPFLPPGIGFDAVGEHQTNPMTPEMVPETKSIIGLYGSWAASLQTQPSLSFRNARWKPEQLTRWKKEALEKTRELVAAPPQPATPEVRIDRTFEYDGLMIEEISWQLPYGRPTRAVVLKPKGAKEPLPAILALHDHAGKKYFGYRKIVKTGDDQHPLLTEHQREDYSGRAWANDVARRGYVVLVHDAFAFGSRRVLYEDVVDLKYEGLDTRGRTDADPEKTEHIEAYNKWSAEHEHVMSKSLFCAGTTWPGVFLSEDQVALSILCGRKDVDAQRVGCGGLSGGGLRTVYLAGMDSRIKCCVCVGFMTTWDDLTLHKTYTHTWMTYTPLLPRYLDFPEILGLRVPLPTMIQCNNQDELYTLPEMKTADKILGEVFKKAGAEDRYAGRFYDGEHKFDQAMQTDAFDWFDRWLKKA